MFEAELELEKKEGGGFGPLLIILLMVGIVIGGIGYMVWQARQTLKPEEAAQILTASFAAKGPAIVRFHAGTVAYDATDDPSGPHYKLLQKLGIVTTKPGKNGTLLVQLTPAGEKQISAFPEFKKKTDGEGGVEYKVPLATKELVKVEKVTRLSPSSAVVEYSWKWKPNELGKQFDAAGSAVQSFNSWERATLIQKYGVDFYDAPPQKTAAKMIKRYDGWHFATE